VLNLLRALLPTKSPKAKIRAARQARPELELLERREVPTVTNHGGALLPNVEVQALYYGSDWWNNSGYYNQTGYLDGFLNNLVHGSYMDTLGNAGYGVGRGSFDSGWVNGVALDKTKYLSDSSLRSALVANINAGNLKAPDSNRLYVIFVEDNVAVGDSSSNSVNNFLGYHGAFGSWLYPPSWSWFGGYSDIRYAVIPYPGGSVPLSTGAVANATRWWLNSQDTITLSASHEIAEAVTDPDVNYKTLGWYDDANGENGDITNAQTVYLNGYAVQRIADKNDQSMTPAGARAVKSVDFVLKTDGNLYMSSGGSLSWLSGGIASVSDQSVDNWGHAMVDVVTTGGAAYEYHEGLGWTYLASGVKSAVAGQGVSYVLYNNNTVYEFKDWANTWTYIDSNVTSISAGTDRYGVNQMTEVWYGSAYEHSDSTGWHYIASGVKAVSAGQQGIIDYLTTAGDAYWYRESDGARSYLGSNVAQVTAGTDSSGNYMIDLLYANGNLYEYRVGGGWSYVWNNVQSIGKGHAGLVDMVFTWGDAYAHDPSGWYYFTSSAKTAA
jgi:hypothetical protein